MRHRAPSSIAVVGAGIVGVQIARALQLAGLEVTLIEQGEPGGATSFGNAGYIATDEIFPLAHGRVLRALPRMLLDPLGPLSVRWRSLPSLAPWLLRYLHACTGARAADGVRALASLQALAAAAWQRTIARDDLSGLVLAHGAWKLFESDGGLAETAGERALQKQHGIEHVVMGRAALREQVPELAAAVRHGVYYPGGMHTVHPLSLTRAMVDRFVADGGQLLRDRVRALAPRATRIEQLLLAERTIPCAAVVVAAGHLSGRLLAPLGLRVPLAAERGYHVEMQYGEIGFDAPLGFHERGFYVTPMRSGLRLAGTTEFTPAERDLPPNWARADILARHVSEVLPGVAGLETSRWMGHRPTLPDFLPALGLAPGSSNLYLAFGHQHLGLTLSAVTGEIMSALVMTGRAPLDLAPYDLARFA